MNNKKANKASRYETYIVVLRAIGEAVKKYSTKGLSDDDKQIPGEIFLIEQWHCTQCDFENPWSIQAWMHYRRNNKLLAAKLKKKIETDGIERVDYNKFIAEENFSAWDNSKLSDFWTAVLEILRNSGMDEEKFLKDLIDKSGGRIEESDYMVVGSLCFPFSWIVGWVAENLPTPE
jgi:hypothetical protein